MHSYCRACGRELVATASIEAGIGPICATHTGQKSGRCEQRDMFMPDFDWFVRRGALVIIDLDLGSRSVTNSVEQVVDWIAEINPAAVALPIIYRDSNKCFDEIVAEKSAGGMYGFRLIGRYNMDLAIDAALERRRVEARQ